MDMTEAEAKSRAHTGSLERVCRDANERGVLLGPRLVLNFYKSTASEVSSILVIVYAGLC